MTFNKRACVVLSGGQDSVTCAKWAQSKYPLVTAVTFHYGQRHASEVESARYLAHKMGLPHRVIDVPLFGGALVNHGERVDTAGVTGLPSTFTPGRNLVFLALAASYAASTVVQVDPLQKADPVPDLITGVCETDFSGYPDCRRTTMDALQVALSLGLDRRVEIITPLMYLDKAATVRLMDSLGGFDMLAHTVTCYQGQRPGCGLCPACILRIKGFLNAGRRDPAYASTQKWADAVAHAQSCHLLTKPAPELQDTWASALEE